LYRDSGDIYRIMREDGVRHIEELWARLTEGEALTIPHHPGDAMHTLDWNHFNQAFEPAVEIFQVRGSYESDDCEMHPHNYGRLNVPSNSVKDGLKRGYAFGFTGGGEHEGVGLTAVYSAGLTRVAVFDAIRKRRFYATTSVKIALDFRIAGHFMGEETDSIAPGSVCDCVIRAVCPNDIGYVALVSADKTEYMDFEPGKEIRLEFKLKADSRYYYVRIKQKDGNIAWSSPIFLKE
jgi:hypothetical protein